MIWPPNLLSLYLAPCDDNNLDSTAPCTLRISCTFLCSYSFMILEVEAVHHNEHIKCLFNAYNGPAGPVILKSFKTGPTHFSIFNMNVIIQHGCKRLT